MGGDEEYSVPKKEIKAKKQMSNTNPYMPGKGIDKLTQVEINSIKYKLRNLKNEEDRRKMAMVWNAAKKREIKFGFFSDEQMIVVQSYFTGLITLNKNAMKDYKIKLDKNKQNLSSEEI